MLPDLNPELRPNLFYMKVLADCERIIIHVAQTSRQDRHLPDGAAGEEAMTNQQPRTGPSPPPRWQDFPSKEEWEKAWLEWDRSPEGMRYKINEVRAERDELKAKLNQTYRSKLIEWSKHERGVKIYILVGVIWFLFAYFYLGWY